MTKCNNKRKYDAQSFPEMLVAIKEGKYTIAKPTGPKYKSEETWAKWRQILDEADAVIKDFYFCISCTAIYNIDISSSGRCLKKHAMKCVGPSEEENRIYDHFSTVFQASKKRKIVREDKTAVKEAAINFIVTDMRPIVSINGNGLCSLLAAMTQIGSKYGAMTESDLSASRIIPSRQTVCIFFWFIQTESWNLEFKKMYGALVQCSQLLFFFLCIDHSQYNLQSRRCTHANENSH